MNRSRLLLALPTATALVLAGGSPAWAGGDGHDYGGDTWAKVIQIHDEAELEDDVLQVTFEYKCEDEDDDDNKVTADVKAEDGDIAYEADDVELDCNREKNEITTDLEKKDDAVEKGDADKGDADKANADKDDADKSDADKSDADKANGDKDDADKGDADKGDADKGDADKDADKDGNHGH